MGLVDVGSYFLCRTHSFAADRHHSTGASLHRLAAVARHEFGPIANFTVSAMYRVGGALSVVHHMGGVESMRDLIWHSICHGTGYRDFVAFASAGKDLRQLNGIVPRQQRISYREWTNCAFGSDRVDDKRTCNSILREIGIPAPVQHPWHPVTLWQDIHGYLKLYVPGTPADRDIVIKTRTGDQGAEVWLARTAESRGRRIQRSTPLVQEITHHADNDNLVFEDRLRSPRVHVDGSRERPLPTLRIVTSLLHSPEPEVLCCVLNIGAFDGIVSNYRQGGQKYAIFARGTCRGSRAEFAPLEDHGFDNSLLRESVEMCQIAHQAFPCVGTIGWDVGLSVRGAVILEGNSRWGMNVPQLVPGFPMLNYFENSNFRERLGFRKGARSLP